MKISGNQPIQSSHVRRKNRAAKNTYPGFAVDLQLRDVLQEIEVHASGELAKLGWLG